ncbi:hypothetical protein S349_63 [Shewanella sp. phage 3/49]|uniref:peptidase HslV family n=1 Tax=Shewanella sp. phage 3/49 TaxID=1458863 RepID=UPI0004F5EDB1|nr:peptidase HslV family [Shewanella sp. phage 3/49]AHK11853.1 hypothetical protein S349_63 [Shewanella sp. phage 3/49]
MTTIAYNHESKQISCDSRSTRNNVIMSDSCEKWISRDGVVFFLAGSPCDNELFIGMYFGAKSDVIPEVTALVVDSGKVYRCGVGEDALMWKDLREHSDAIGSGWEFSLSAMDFGKSSHEAVEHAITRDSCSGGKIHTYDIKLKQFI